MIVDTLPGWGQGVIEYKYRCLKNTLSCEGIRDEKYLPTLRPFHIRSPGRGSGTLPKMFYKSTNMQKRFKRFYFLNLVLTNSDDVER